MTTSSNHSTPSAPRPTGEHWNELTATLSAESVETLGQWLSEDLEALTGSLERYASPRSILKSISR